MDRSRKETKSVMFWKPHEDSVGDPVVKLCKILNYVYNMTRRT